MGIHPGVKIVCSGREGTLGLLVVPTHETGKIYLMTCWHVLDAGTGNSDVMLPGDGNQVVARYQRSTTTANREFDAAIAEILPGHGLPISNQITDGSGTISQADFWDIGMDLTKYGAETQRTLCRLTGDSPQYGDLRDGLILGKHPQGVFKYCSHGDSGAVWCNRAGEAVGLHCKGNLDGNVAAATPVMFILVKMGLSILR